MPTPEQKKLRLGHRDAAGRMAPAPLPRPGVEEITPQTQNYTSSDTRMTRGQTGLGDVAADSRERIRANAATRNAPVQPDLFSPQNMAHERSNILGRAQDAIERSKRFTNAPGTLTEPAGAPARPPGRGGAVGGVLGLGLGASDTAMNAARVYDRTDGDIGQTAQQVMHDVPGAVLGGLGAMAGGIVGRRSPAATVAGSTALGGVGYTAGGQIARGVDRMVGGDGMSPLDAMRAEEQQAAQSQELLPDGGFVVQVQPNDEDVPGWPETVYADDPRHPLYQAPAEDPQATAEEAPVEQPMAMQPQLGEPQAPMAMSPMPETQGNGFGQTGIPNIVGRMGENDVPEFTNDPDAIAGATGEFTAGGRLGNGQGTFSVVSGGQEAMQRNNAATEIYRDMRTTRRGDRMANEQRISLQNIRNNDIQIRQLMSTGRPRDRMQARALMQQNQQLHSHVQSLQEGQQAIELGRTEAETARRASSDSLQAERVRLQAERDAAAQSKNSADAIEESAKRNAEGWDSRLQNVFGRRDRDGNVSIPPEVGRMIELRQGTFAEQRRDAMDSMVADLQQRAQSGDPEARTQLEQVAAQRDQMVAEMFRIGPDGEPIEPRPVAEWPQEVQDLFLRDMDGQMRAQAPKSDSVLPELGGAAAGAAAGMRASRGRPPLARLGAVAAGAAAGGLGGYVTEQSIRGERSYAPQGSTNQSFLMPNNLNRVYADGDNLMVQTQDGQTVNFNDMVRENVNPSPILGRRGEVSGEAQPAVRAAFTKALQLAQQGDADAISALQLMASNNRAIYMNMLSEPQRQQLRRFVGAGQ